MFLAAANLTSQALAPATPWTFEATENLTEHIRTNKAARQEWYQNPQTQHQFYTGVEPWNPNIRVSKDNPPRMLHAFIADYDVPYEPEQLKATMARWRIKPTYLERSLGRCWRAVWVLEAPLAIPSNDFCISLLAQAEVWLDLGILAGLDGKSFLDPARLYANGGVWEATGFPPVSANASQAFFVECGQSFSFVGKGDTLAIPFPVLEVALQKQFPNFSWPCEFTLDTQGPSFFVTGSVSPKSAILKQGGFFTFAAHAEKSFYSWQDLLGADFTRKYEESSLAEATRDIYFDGRSYYRRDANTGAFVPVPYHVIALDLRVRCNRSAKVPKGRVSSPLDEALQHIHTYGHVSGCAPMLFQPEGIITCASQRILNTYRSRVLLPSEQTGQVWGEAGNFPVLSRHFDNFFDPPEQLYIFLAWLKHFYTGALTSRPNQGQAVFLAGGTNIGKTYTNVAIIGKLLGGHVDASKYLIEGEAFNSQLFSSPLWCVDDEAASAGDDRHRNKFAAAIKKAVANTTSLYHEKFRVPVTVEWMGRTVITTNLDFQSSRILLSPDDGSQDKISLFKCVQVAKYPLPGFYELAEITNRELPHFARWLLEWTPPETVKTDKRFGYAAYQNPALVERVNQTGEAAPLAEMLQNYLGHYFRDNGSATEWRGTATELLGTLGLDAAFGPIVQKFTVRSLNRSLELCEKSQLVTCSAATDSHTHSRVWTFPRKQYK